MKQDLNTLKEYFETNTTITEEEMSDLLDTFKGAFQRVELVGTTLEFYDLDNTIPVFTLNLMQLAGGGTGIVGEGYFNDSTLVGNVLRFYENTSIIATVDLSPILVGVNTSISLINTEIGQILLRLAGLEEDYQGLKLTVNGWGNDVADLFLRDKDNEVLSRVSLPGIIYNGHIYEYELDNKWGADENNRSYCVGYGSHKGTVLVVPYSTSANQMTTAQFSFSDSDIQQRWYDGNLGGNGVGGWTPWKSVVDVEQIINNHQLPIKTHFFTGELFGTNLDDITTSEYISYHRVLLSSADLTAAGLMENGLFLPNRKGRCSVTLTVNFRRGTNPNLPFDNFFNGSETFNFYWADPDVELQPQEQEQWLTSQTGSDGHFHVWNANESGAGVNFALLSFLFHVWNLRIGYSAKVEIFDDSNSTVIRR